VLAVTFSCVGPLAALGCGSKSPTPAPKPSASATQAPASLCADGHSEDPPHAALLEPTQLFRDQKYAPARAALDALVPKYPKSATVLALRGDATLFDESIAYEKAAEQALTYYGAATKLVDAGCAVDRRTEYYLLMGDAYASLRLRDMERAFTALSRAEKRWPTSAEIHYNLARVRCERANQFAKRKDDAPAKSPGSAAQAKSREAEVEACVQGFERALELAESPERPLFFRTHRSAEDWIVRSETQSELGSLRSDPRYRSIIERARARVAGKLP
jgi:hypothetical protein